MGGDAGTSPSHGVDSIQQYSKYLHMCNILLWVLVVNSEHLKLAS
jgi:hypothetical protein